MSSSDEVSAASLEQIKVLLSNLNASDVWDLINYIRNECSVLIPVWFTVPLVQEISNVELTEEQAVDMIENINDNDLSYTLGRNLVESFMANYVEQNMGSDEEEDNEGDD